ncbi:MAG: PAS domain S-box protein [Thermodesulfobacteriota bacterium]
MQSFSILFVDDDELNLLNFKLIFQDKYEILTASSGEEGFALFQKNPDIGLIISDQRMPGISGTDMLSRIYDIDPDPIRVILTGHNEVTDVMDAINVGRIYQYILKPWDRGEMMSIIERARDLFMLRKENIVLTEELAERNERLEQTNRHLLELNEQLKKDVEKRAILKASLVESEERFRKFTQASQDIIVLFDMEGRGVYSNPAVKKLLGYESDELNGKLLIARLHRNDREMVKKVIGRILSNNGSSRPLEVHIQKKDKTYTNGEMSFFIITLESGERIIGSIIRDISLRKIAQEELRLSRERLSDLTAMLINAQDDERRRLSMELHDEFGQSLAAFKMHLRAMENDVNQEEDDLRKRVVEGLGELRQDVNQQITSVRNLSQELWPLVVDDLGLDAAFVTLIDGYLSNSACELDINMEPIAAFFPIEEQRHLYRLLQESLNNVIKHADASRIQVRAGQVADTIILAIHDNGVGFDVDEVAHHTGKSRGMGLQAMDERVKLMNGVMEINSRPGMGTSIIFTLTIDGSHPCKTA